MKNKYILKRHYLIMLLLIGISSCNFTSHYIDREEDKREAEKTLTVFYSLIKKERFKESLSMYSPTFFKVTGKKELIKYCEMINEKLGEIKNLELTKWNTNITIGAKSSSNYVFVYEVERSDFSSTETITLAKENNKIKIMAYNIISDGFE